jgi:hypothetical protein
LHIYPLTEGRSRHNRERINAFNINNQLYEIHAIHDSPSSNITEDDEKCAGIPK